MSNQNMNYSGSRTGLLATASALALLLSVYGNEPAIAADAASEPSVWIELGWHAESANSADNFALPVGSPIPQSGLTGPLVEKLNLSRSIGDDGKITFQPSGSDWVFSGSVRYGRSQGRGHTRQASPPITKTSFDVYHFSVPGTGYHRTVGHPVQATQTKFGSESINSESHTIIDFEAGKDVGLGLFGDDSKSTLSAGVRFAHFSVVRNVSNLVGTIDNQFSYSHFGNPPIWFLTFGRETWDTFTGVGRASHDFRAIGPSFNWDVSAPIWSPQHDSNVSIDWGVNAAFLFGQQKDKSQTHTTVGYHCTGGGCHALSAFDTETSEGSTRKRATVPNVGGFAGISYRVLDFKASIGYRADFFFHALNTGVDGQRAVTRGYQGPYASISIGIGD